MRIACYDKIVWTEKAESFERVEGPKWTGGGMVDAAIVWPLMCGSLIRKRHAGSNPARSTERHIVVTTLERQRWTSRSREARKPITTSDSPERRAPAPGEIIQTGSTNLDRG